ncbi:diguanylate cyclase [Psychromonas sp. psych-6C06]|uniref:diguanylate cyclase n=1 Tax=Psychromonas sp. psych-6C06 TaxID=2058089 RepID=UPI001EE765F5|nr:diguanylate cyclase [Psychromonas sp. psych-6C06]
MKSEPLELTSELDINTLTLVFEHLPTAYILASVDRKIVTMNQAAETLFAYSHNELNNSSTKVLYADPSDHEKQGRQRFNPLAEYSNETYAIEYKSKFGRIFKGYTTGGPVKDKTGKILFYVASIMDESDRLKAEDTLGKLHTITSSRHLDFTQRVDAILKLGCEQFALPIAIFSKITGDKYTIKQAVHPDDALEIGMEFELGITYCSHVYLANDVQGFNCVSKSHISSHPCFSNFGLEAYLGAPIFVDGERYGTLNFSSPEPTRPFIKQDIELVRLFAEWVGHEIARNHDLNALKEAQQQLELLANTDMLTGIANRRSIDEALQKQLANSNRYNLSMSVAIFDFDHFKVVNDTYGHHVGDQALKLFGDLINKMSREGDFYGRWGGEEFLAIFPSTDLMGAKTFVERLQQRLKSMPIKHQDNDIIITLSVGIVIRKANDNSDSIVRRADELLYKAKENGRDRIELDTQ